MELYLLAGYFVIGFAHYLLVVQPLDCTANPVTHIAFWPYFATKRL